MLFGQTPNSRFTGNRCKSGAAPATVSGINTFDVTEYNHFGPCRGKVSARLFQVNGRRQPGDRPAAPTSHQPDCGGQSGVLINAACSRQLPDHSLLSASGHRAGEDRKSTRLNSSHVAISYAVS